MEVSVVAVHCRSGPRSNALKFGDVGVLNVSRLFMELARTSERFDEALPQHGQPFGDLTLLRRIKACELVEQSAILVRGILRFVAPNRLLKRGHRRSSRFSNERSLERTNKIR